ncbi:MAG: hypothetical protein R3F54_06515 [Alphaproteobacteria bacterium]
MSVKLTLLLPAEAHAHVSEQGFVLLLPTEAYSTAGVAAVALTVLALFALPGSVIHALFRAKNFRGPDLETARSFTSLISLLLLGGLLAIGLFGPRDPLSNLMPLFFWTLGWVGLVSLAGLFGDLGRWIEPWTGLYRLLGRVRPPIALPETLGVWPAVLLLVGFAAFLLADIAPDDPARLAWRVGIYWFVTMAGLILCGPAWLRQVELGSVILRTYAGLAALRLRPDGGIGTPGWRLLERPASLSVGIFALTLLAVGSFDGINETFWWLALIGINPLEFPGRSAVVWPTLLGLIAAILTLIAAFALTVWLGLLLTRSERDVRETFGRLAPSMLPIAFAYHIAHYLTSFLVTIQHTVAALSDPFATGADLLGIHPFYVTTGFFNHIDSVRLIWLTQAGVVVLGHVWSVLLAHRIALDLFPGHRRAALATAPLSLFMIAYTMLGLWLLATPKGA